MIVRSLGRVIRAQWTRIDAPLPLGWKAALGMKALAAPEGRWVARSRKRNTIVAPMAAAGGVIVGSSACSRLFRARAAGVHSDARLGNR